MFILSLNLTIPPSQVACFCSTVMATELVASGQLPIGSSRADSERLLQQTAEALEANVRWGEGPQVGRPQVGRRTSGGETSGVACAFGIWDVDMPVTGAVTLSVAN